MAEMQQLKLLVSERLTAAAEEIFGLFEKTITEYQEEVVRSKRETIQLKKQLDQLTVLQPRVVLFKEEVQSIPAHKTEVQVEKQTEAHVCQEIKKEPLDVCIFPDVNSDSSNYVKLSHPGSEMPSQTELEMLPNDGSITVTLEEEFNDVNDDWIENPDSSSGSAPIPGAVAALQLKQASWVQKPCHMCGMNFLKDCTLMKHMTDSHPGHKAFKCLECHKEFFRRDHLIMHLRVHTGEKPYPCLFCGRSFVQSSTLKVHMRRHTGEKPYHCDICGKRFSYSNHLRTCTLQSFEKARALNGEKPFRCLRCGKKFNTSSDLSIHLKIHGASALNSRK